MFYDGYKDEHQLVLVRVKATHSGARPGSTVVQGVLVKGLPKLVSIEEANRLATGANGALTVPVEPAQQLMLPLEAPSPVTMLAVKAVEAVRVGSGPIRIMVKLGTPDGGEENVDISSVFRRKDVGWSKFGRGVFAAIYKARLAKVAATYQKGRPLTVLDLAPGHLAAWLQRAKDAYVAKPMWLKSS